MPLEPSPPYPSTQSCCRPLVSIQMHPSSAFLLPKSSSPLNLYPIHIPPLAFLLLKSMAPRTASRRRAGAGGAPLWCYHRSTWRRAVRRAAASLHHGRSMPWWNEPPSILLRAAARSCNPLLGVAASPLLVLSCIRRRHTDRKATTGYHRSYSHRWQSCNRLPEKLSPRGATGAGTGSPFCWKRMPRCWNRRPDLLQP